MKMTLLCLGMLACERDPATSTHQQPRLPTSATAPPRVPPAATATTTSPPVVAETAPAPASLPPTPKLRSGQPDRTGARRRHRVLTEDELPTPPDAPADYNAWLARQPRAIRAQIDVFCRDQTAEQPPAWNYRAVCGGIGPYHIPAPPSLAASPGPDGVSPFVKHDLWLAALSVEQRRYFKYWCEDNTDEGAIGFSMLCGGTPLVAQLDLSTPIELVAGGVNAELTPWLALDRDHDGRIDDASELFGDGTPMPGGTHAADGFAALAQYDANRDGVIDRSDPIYAELVLWTGREMIPLASRITSIELANHREPRCTRFGCEGERSTMTTVTGSTGAIVDIYIARAAITSSSR